MKKINKRKSNEMKDFKYASTLEKLKRELSVKDRITPTRIIEELPETNWILTVEFLKTSKRAVLTEKIEKAAPDFYSGDMRIAKLKVISISTNVMYSNDEICEIIKKNIEYLEANKKTLKKK